VIDPSARTLTRLGRLVGDGTKSVSDADLLRRYMATRDGTAFAALVRRLGPMVFGVCRRTLGHAQDAEDAFQATFLILARKAHAVRPDSLSRWLYRVAVRVANKARVRRARRMAVEREVEYASEPIAAPAPGLRDWLPLLDAALERLSDRDRRPILLCDLLGRSRAEAAAELGIAEGTLSSRLARSRDKLRTKLARLGAALSLPTLAAGLADEAVATVPASLIQSTIAAESTAAAARELAEGVMRTMFLAKFTKLALIGACLAGAVAAGVIWLPGTGSNPTAIAKETPKGAPPAGKDSPKADSDLARIQGTWLIESAQVPDGSGPRRPMPGFGPSRGGSWLGATMTFADGRVDCGMFPSGSQFFRLDPGHDPKRIDFTFRDVQSGGTRYRAIEAIRPSIYRFDEGKLQIVLGDEELRARPDSFEPGGKASPFIYLTLRRPNSEEAKSLQYTEQALLQGTWNGFLETLKGEERAATSELKLVVKGDRLRFDRTGTDSLHATFSLDISARPWRIDLTATGDGVKKGQLVPGIIARLGEFLLLSLGTESRPANFEAARKDGTVYVFVREGRSTRTAMEFWKPLTPAPTAPARETPAKSDNNKRLRELQQERVKALEEQSQGQFERVKIGKDPLIQLINVMQELAEARLEVAENREQRMAAIESLLKDCRLVEDQLRDLQAAGLQTKQGVAQAKSARLKAEIQLEKLKAEK